MSYRWPNKDCLSFNLADMMFDQRMRSSTLLRALRAPDYVQSSGYSVHLCNGRDVTVYYITHTL